MRVDRALEKLRRRLARRGLTSTASGLTAALAIGVITPAPAAWPQPSRAQRLASGTAVGSTTLTLLKMMSLSKAKVGLIGALVVTGVAVPVWQETRLQRVRSENAQLRENDSELAALQGRIGATAESRGRSGRTRAIAPVASADQPELLRLRGMAGRPARECRSGGNAGAARATGQ